jgi:integrase
MARDLTQVFIDRISPAAARQEIPDGKVRGLFLIVQPSGAMSWGVRYRFAGAPKKFTVGTYPGISLKAARELASEALTSVARGIDPSAQKKAAKTAKRLSDAEAENTVEAVVNRFKAEYLEEFSRPATIAETSRMLNKEFVGAYGNRSLMSITDSDIAKLIGGIKRRGSPVMANRLLGRLKKLFAWAVSQKIVMISPCKDIDPPAPEQSRERVLSESELAHIWRAAGKLDWPFGPIFQLLILTGARRDEVADARWSEYDLDQRLWTIPRERTKNGREHIVPLSPAAVGILEKLPRVESKLGLVFTTTGETPVQGFSRVRDRVAAHALASMRQEGSESGRKPEDIELPHWTLHDFRRTVATGLQRLRIDLIVVEKILNHTSGSLRGVAGIYARHAFTDEKRAALDLWSRHVEAIVRGAPVGNVVDLALARA